MSVWRYFLQTVLQTTAEVPNIYKTFGKTDYHSASCCKWKYLSYPYTLIKGLYLCLDISMIIFFRSSYLQPKLPARLLVYCLYIVSIKLVTSFSYERKMGLLKKYVSKNYNKTNCRCFSKKHSRLNQDFFFSKHFIFQLAAISQITNPWKNTHTDVSKFHAETILKMRGFFLRLYMDRLNISRFYKIYKNRCCPTAKSLRSNRKKIAPKSQLNFCA